MTVYVFDMDGTLTPPRLPMTSDFAVAFKPWLANHIAYIATGSDFKKVEEQLGADVIDAFTGIYCAMGNQLRRGHDIVYQKNFQLSDELHQDLEYFRKTSAYPGPFFDNYIEERVGMVNFSVLGRNCPYDERIRYQQWDQVNGERNAIRETLTQKYPQLEISVGGSISIDITPVGCGKGQIAHYVRDAYPDEHIVFMGDRTFPGGNDHELAAALSLLPDTETIQVEGPEAVLTYLKQH